MKTVGVFNGHAIAALAPDQVYISFSPSQTGRGAMSARYQVVRIGYRTDPNAHFLDNGHKTFSAGIRKEQALRDAMEWADKRYGKREWLRDPYGNYQDARVIPLLWEKIRAQKA